MTACDVHEPIWVESDKYTGFECGRCMTMIETASGLCGLCRLPMDDHALVLPAQPVCPQRKK